jgi:hypothetical protein
MTLQQAILVALMVVCSIPVTAQQAPTSKPIALGNSYESVETFCRNRADALEVADAIESAVTQEEPRRPGKRGAGSCNQALVAGVYVSTESTYRLMSAGVLVTIYRVDDAKSAGASLGTVYVISPSVLVEKKF